MKTNAGILAIMQDVAPYDGPPLDDAFQAIMANADMDTDEYRYLGGVCSDGVFRMFGTSRKGPTLCDGVAATPKELALFDELTDGLSP